MAYRPKDGAWGTPPPPSLPQGGIGSYAQGEDTPPPGWSNPTPAIPRSQDPLIGQYIQRLQVVEKIGQGGFGAVYRAQHIDTHRSFAVKVLNLNLQGNEEAVERFRREARAMGQLDHPNVVRVADFGFLEHYNFYYLVMEYLEGRTLQQVVKRHEQRGGEWIAQVVHQLCAALDYVHKKQIVHRDLKPGNVFLLQTQRGEIVKLLDFGIAAISEDGSLTQSGACMGSPTYMSPEQAEGNTRHVDHRADQYSLGIMLYELLTGTPPFRGDSFASLLRQHLLDPPPPLARSYPQQRWVPRLEGVFQRILAKTPQERFADIPALWTAFDAAFREQLATFGYQSPTADMTFFEQLSDSQPSVLPSGNALWDSQSQSASGASARQRATANTPSASFSTASSSTHTLPPYPSPPTASTAHFQETHILPAQRSSATKPLWLQMPFLVGAGSLLFVSTVFLLIFLAFSKQDLPADITPPPPAAALPSEARVLLKSDPQGVEVFTTKGLLCVTPCPLLGKPNEIRVVELRKKGYYTKKAEVPFPEKGAILREILLTKIPPPPPPRPLIAQQKRTKKNTRKYGSGRPKPNLTKPAKTNPQNTKKSGFGLGIEEM
jgi:serine/threonine protein kinase